MTSFGAANPDSAHVESRKVLVTGGVRSGKSFQAETLVIAEEHVTYVAPGPEPNAALDPEWADRVQVHQDRRPDHWSTIETSDLSFAFEFAQDAILIDCLGTWVTALIDELDGWDKTRDEWLPEFMRRVDRAVEALAKHEGTVVVVTNEVGWGVVPEHRSGRVFSELLGTVNQRFALECDDVLLVVSGRVLHL